MKPILKLRVNVYIFTGL